MSVFIEHTAGWFPLWCAPEQVRILTVSDEIESYAQKVSEILAGIELEEPIQHNQLRYSLDNSDARLGKKIKRATGLKIPIAIILGKKDEEAGEVSVRLRDGEEKVPLEKLEEFIRGRSEKR